MSQETALRTDGGSNSYLCVTCGNFKPAYKFREGDCTCRDCNEDGRGSVNYELNDGEVVEVE